MAKQEILEAITKLQKEMISSREGRRWILDKSLDRLEEALFWYEKQLKFDKLIGENHVEEK